MAGREAPTIAEEASSGGLPSPAQTPSEHPVPKTVEKLSKPKKKAAKWYLQVDWKKRALASNKCPFGIPRCPGCGTPGQVPDETTINAHRAFFFHELMGEPSSTLDQMSIRNPAAYRDALFVRFFDAHFPLDQPARYLVLPRLRDAFVPRTPAMAAALDCLLLVQFAVDTGDPRFKIESRKRQHAAIQHLRVALEDPKAAYEDGTLGAVDALTIIEMYAETSQGEDAWKFHARGMCDIMRARGPKSITTPYARTLLMDSLHVALMDAMTSRRSFLFGEEEWLAATSHFSNSRMNRLLHLACQIPGLLERTDKLTMSSKTKSEDLGCLLNDLVELEGRFQAWLLDWYSSQDGILPYTLVKTSRFEEFATQYGLLTKIFPNAVLYTNLLQALGHEYYWFLLLPVRDAIYDIARHPLAPQAVDLNKFKDAATECAQAICQSVPYLSLKSPKCTCGVLATCGPLSFAARWYEKIADGAKSHWCRTVGETLDAGHSRAAPIRKTICMPRAFSGWLAVAFP
jgi:hypothetical protein